MEYGILFWLLLFLHWTDTKICKQEKKCQVTRVYGLKTADCYKMDMKEFPKCLASDIEVIELSYNRIRKLNKGDLSNYGYVKHLYLTDNLIMNLEGECFKDLNYLETLDLSLNAIRNVPPAIFQLPSLKTLYLSQNLNINIAETIEKAKPISSPLSKLDFSFITEREDIVDFPDFGEMPFLAFLNITGNHFSYISPRHFAGMCNLQILANENVTNEFEDNCDCWRINNWLLTKNVKFTLFPCVISAEECLDHELSNEDEELHKNCLLKLKDIEKTALMSKIGIGIGSCIGIVLLVLLLIFYRSLKRKYMDNRKSKVSCQLSETAKPLNTEPKL
ncbi:tsukushi [Cylas formicarius]|uniref:tsukushi n=1 Tax=Cylas formicarius TaxID=197179 RepID=UPI0029583C02|nr:tsukushi [Cylas formicarius]